MRSTAMWWCGGLLALAGCGSPTRTDERVVIDERAGAAPTAAAPILIDAARGGGKAPAAGSSGAALPPEVIAFRVRRDACDHVRGEDGYDEARVAFLSKEAERTCTGADAALRSLGRRYASDPAVIVALSGYEDAVK